VFDDGRKRCVGDASETILSPLCYRGHRTVFESLRKSLDDLLSRSTPPEERRQIVSRMRDTLVQARVGLQDLRDGLAQSKRRLESERRELDTVQRRKRLAEQINDAETVRLAGQYEQMHVERVAVLERKVEAQESELALAERDVAQMMTELRQAASGIPSAGERSSGAVNAAMDEIESELGSGSGKNGSLGDEIDGLSRARTRADHEADAARKLEELKRRMGN
jgi:chromosome segregation ATPase